MPASILWRLMFRVSDRAGFDACLEPTLQLLGDGAFVSDAPKPYWKRPELWECTVKVPCDGRTAAEQAYRCLCLATSVAVGWEVLGALSEARAEDFSGVFSRGANQRTAFVPGLEWASFDLLDAESSAADGAAGTG